MESTLSLVNGVPWLAATTPLQRETMEIIQLPIVLFIPLDIFDTLQEVLYWDLLFFCPIRIVMYWDNAWWYPGTRLCWPTTSKVIFTKITCCWLGIGSIWKTHHTGSQKSTRLVWIKKAQWIRTPNLLSFILQHEAAPCPSRNHPSWQHFQSLVTLGLKFPCWGQPVVWHTQKAAVTMFNSIHASLRFPLTLIFHCQDLGANSATGKSRTVPRLL